MTPAASDGQPVFQNQAPDISSASNTYFSQSFDSFSGGVSDSKPRHGNSGLPRGSRPRPSRVGRKQTLSSLGGNFVNNRAGSNVDVSVSYNASCVWSGGGEKNEESDGTAHKLSSDSDGRVGISYPLFGCRMNCPDGLNLRELNEDGSCCASNSHPHLVTGDCEVNTAGFTFGVTSNSKTTSDHACTNDAGNGRNFVDFAFVNNSELMSHKENASSRKTCDANACFNDVEKSAGTGKEFQSVSQNIDDSSWCNNCTSDIDSKFQAADASDSTCEKGPLFSATVQLRGLVIDDSYLHSNRTGDFHGNPSMTSFDAFMFGSRGKNINDCSAHSNGNEKVKGSSSLLADEVFVFGSSKKNSDNSSVYPNRVEHCQGNSSLNSTKVFVFGRSKKSSDYSNRMGKFHGNSSVNTSDAFVFGNWEKSLNDSFVYSNGTENNEGNSSVNTDEALVFGGSKSNIDDSSVQYKRNEDFPANSSMKTSMVPNNDRIVDDSSVYFSEAKNFEANSSMKTSEVFVFGSSGKNIDVSSSHIGIFQGNSSVKTTDVLVFGTSTKKTDDDSANSNETENIKSNPPLNTGKAFVFERLEEKSSVWKQSPPKAMSMKTPAACNLPHQSFFQLVDNGSLVNSAFSETPSSVDKGEKDHSNAASQWTTLDSSVSGITTQKMNYDPPFNFSFVVSGENSNNESISKSVGVQKSVKKRREKLRTRRASLLLQNKVSLKVGPTIIDSPACSSSPMDISPCQDTYTSTSQNSEPTCTGKEEIPSYRNEKLGQDEASKDIRNNYISSASLCSHNGISALRRHKKYKAKVRTNNNDKKNAEELPLKDVEACDQWRIRGNQAYHAGQLSKAEEFYTMGINSVSHDDVQGCSLESVLLCYSNRAASRMSLGRIREAIEDCKSAEELDPRFLKATLRAGNCYLVLGEVEAAILHYDKCLSSGNGVCLDRRITIEAADGLQRSRKVAELSHQSAKLLEERTRTAASNALISIEMALSISCYSERLLEMKGEALSILWRHDEVIRLCEQTLDTAKMNCNYSGQLADHDSKCSRVEYWRWKMQIKAYYQLGRFSLALDLIEKSPAKTSKQETDAQGSVAALAATIHELLCLKRSGNEAFKDGRYTEAIEHYSCAISKSFESPPFMAICFCNRAAAYQSLNQFADGILDCSLAIALDENYQKAISRRATLHELIRDYKQAASDLQRLLSLLETQSHASKDGCNRDQIKVHDRLSYVQEMTKKEIPLDFYRILGVQRSDSEPEIKKAYRRAALKHHPDKARQVLMRNDNGDDEKLWGLCFDRIHSEADRLFKMIGEAYAVLSDPQKKLQYNEEETQKLRKNSYRTNGTYSRSSTSHGSSPGRGSWSGAQAGWNASSASRSSRNRRYWNDAWE